MFIYIYIYNVFPSFFHLSSSSIVEILSFVFLPNYLMMGLVSIHLLYLGVFKIVIELSQYSFFEFYFSITNLTNNSLN